MKIKKIVLFSLGLSLAAQMSLIGVQANEQVPEEKMIDDVTSISENDSAEIFVESEETFGDYKCEYDAALNGYKITQYIGSASTITIPESINGKPVINIGNRAFFDCTSMTSVIIPNGVTSIGDSAFKQCENLTSVAIPNSVTSIGNEAFACCTSLTSITIPDSVTYMGGHIFNSCTNLTSATFPDNLTSIPTCTFYGCEKLTSFTIPDSVTSIGDSAFYQCKSLTSITISNRVTSIGFRAFSGCESITSVAIPNSVTDTGFDAFSHCTSLETVTIADGVKIIQSQSFEGCTSLTTINIPNSVKSIGDSAFHYCTSLTTIDIPDSVTHIGSHAFNLCGRLTSITIPNGVTSIGTMSFGFCTSLTSIDIPSSVTSIDKSAFYGCSGLVSVTIADGVTSIETWAFAGCTSLTAITLPDSVTSIGKEAFMSRIITISGYRYSYAETYASEYNIPFIYLGDDERNQRIEAFVSRMYTVALGRPADSSGLEDWSNQLKNHTNDGAGLARGFICSAEFINKNLSNEAYIDTLYKTFFDREPDAGGKSNWMNELNGGTSRNEVLAGFVNSEEFANLCDKFSIARGTLETNGSSIYNEGVRNFVSRLYTKCLKRKGETLGVEDWTNRINKKQMMPEEVAKSFFTSDEFVNKKLYNDEYVETLYQTFMNRPSDSDGKEYWVNRLNSGVSRQEVLEGFSRSPEFAKIMASFGL